MIITIKLLGYIYLILNKLFIFTIITNSQEKYYKSIKLITQCGAEHLGANIKVKNNVWAWKASHSKKSYFFEELTVPFNITIKCHYSIALFNSSTEWY